MKVLFLCEGYRPGTDACAKRMGVFADHLKALGHEVVVLASSTNLDGGREPEDGVVYCKAAPLRKKTALRRLFNNASFCYSVIKAARDTGDADVVVATSPPLFISLACRRIARMKSAPFVFDVRDIWPEIAYEMGSFTERSIFGRVFRYLSDAAYRDANLLVAVTPGKVEKLKRILSSRHLESSKIRLIGNGLDEAFLDQADDEGFAAKYAFDEGFTCVYAGNLGLAQGLSQLLDLASWARSAYPDSRFLIFGKGAEEDLLRQRVLDDDLENVEFGGAVSERQVFTALRHAKMSFVCLKNRNMTSSVPTKVFESLGCGCPVLLAAKGDAQKIVEQTGLGVCVEPDDFEGLKGAYSSMRQKYDDIICLRDDARKIIVSDHSRQKQAVLFEQLLVKLVLEGK